MIDQPGGLARNRSGGFSLIEVLVALMIMAIISAAVAQAVVTTGSTQARAKARTQQVALAEGGLEKAASDAGWAKVAACRSAIATSPTSTGCTITTSSFACGTALDAAGWCVVTEQLDSGDTAKFQVRGLALGFDNPADGSGLVATNPNRDRDGLVPDYFRVNLEVRQQKADGTFDVATTHHLTGDINPVTRANSGSVQVRTCALTNQIDHRQPVMHCPRSSSIEMYPPLEFSGAWEIEEGHDDECDEDDPGDDECDGRFGREEVDEDDAKSVDGRAFDSVDGPWKGLQFSPVGGVGYTLTPLKSDSLTVDPSRTVITGVTQPDGTGISQSVTAGQYRISFNNIPSNYVTWDDHSLPGDGLLSVSTGVMTHVSQTFQPRPVTLTIQFSHLEETYTMPDPDTKILTSSIARPGTERADWLRLIAAPLERVPIFGVNAPGRIVGDGEMVRVEKDTAQVTFHNVSPGLYSAYVVSGRNTGSDFKLSTVEDGRLQTEPHTDFHEDHPDLDYIYIEANGVVHAGGDEAPEGTAIWYNTHHDSCSPANFCNSGGGGGSGNGGASSSGGSGGL